MRSILIFGLVFTLAAVPAVQAQQFAAPARTAEPAPRVVETPLPVLQVDTAPVQAVAVQSKQEVVAAEARREMTARTLLAIIGGAVVVLGLIVLLR